MLIDSHCHLDRIDLKPYQDDFACFMQAATDHQIERLLCIAIDLESYPAMLDLVATRWIRPGGVQEQRRSSAVPAWSFRVPLTHTDALEIEGGFESAGGFDFVGFARIASRTYPAEGGERGGHSGQEAAILL